MSEDNTSKADLGAVFDAHVAAEFADQDVDATMATMVPEPYITHVPTLAGGTGGEEVRAFYSEFFIGHFEPGFILVYIKLRSNVETLHGGRVGDEVDYHAIAR